MTKPLESDGANRTAEKSLALPFASSDLETAGIRVTRAEFSRLMGCSKQAVTDWVKAGRVTVGADGRIDPRHAVRSLLATGDPAKIRARVLAPLVGEMDKLRQRVAQLESALKLEKENAEFHEAVHGELRAILDALHFDLTLCWDDMRKLPKNVALLAIDDWIEAATDHGGRPGGCLADFIEQNPTGNGRSPKYSEENLLRI